MNRKILEIINFLPCDDEFNGLVNKGTGVSNKFGFMSDETDILFSKETSLIPVANNKKSYEKIL